MKIYDKRPVLVKGAADSSWPEKAWNENVASALGIPATDVVELGLDWGYAMLGHMFTLTEDMKDSSEKMVHYKNADSVINTQGYDYQTDKIPTSLIAYIDATKFVK